VGVTQLLENLPNPVPTDNGKDIGHVLFLFDSFRQFNYFLLFLRPNIVSISSFNKQLLLLSLKLN
jgi:hypothetical protein